MKDRFLTYRLGDNDFGQQMERAARWLVESYGTETLKALDDLKFRGAMASHMAGETVACDHVDNRGETCGLQHYYAYFCGAKIDRTREGAEADSDGGYVSVDLATGYVWRH